MHKSTLHNQKIYFICGGTSTNNIIQSINKNISKNISKQEKSFYDSLFSTKKDEKKDETIPEEEFSKLDELGINEIFNCYNNSKVKDLIDKELHTKEHIIYTSLNCSCIESASLLFYNNDSDIVLFPLPNISNISSIKTKKNFHKFKELLGKYLINNNNIKSIKEETSMNKYWDMNMIPINKRKIKGKIDWIHTRVAKNSELSEFKYTNFKNFFHKEALSKFNKKSDIEDEDNFKNYIFVCESNLIIDTLKEINDNEYKYNNNIDIIEHSSVWQIHVDLFFEYDSSHTIKSKKIIYKRFTKIYPTIHNHHPLNKDYEYKYKDNTYKLFNSIDNIDIEYIKKLNFFRYSDNIRTSIRKFFNINNTKKNNKNNKNKNNKTVNFDKLS